MLLQGACTDAVLVQMQCLTQLSQQELLLQLQVAPQQGKTLMQPQHQQVTTGLLVLVINFRDIYAMVHQQTVQALMYNLMSLKVWQSGRKRKRKEC